MYKQIQEKYTVCPLGAEQEITGVVVENGFGRIN